MNRRMEYRILSIIAVLIFFVLALFIWPNFLPKQDLSFDNEAVTELTAWSYTDSKGTRDITLPTNTNAKAGETVIISAILPQKNSPGQSICVRASLQEITIAVDGKNILQTNHSGYPFGKSPASSWQIVRLPQNSQGKEITISFTSPYKKISGQLNTVYYGSKSAIMFKIVRDNWFNIVVSSLICIFGIVILLSYTMFTKGEKRHYRLAFLGLFAITVAFWVLGESKMLQFFTHNQLVLYIMPHLALLTFPIPFIYYVDTSYEKHFKTPYSIMAAVFGANLVFTSILQCFSIKDYFEMLPVVHILIILSCILITVFLSVESIKYKNKEAASILKSFTILFFCGILEIINFYNKGFVYVSRYMKIGLLVYIIVLGYTTIQKKVRLTYAEKEAQMYEKLAFTDQLTGAKNRNAYYRDIKKIFSSKIKNNLWLIMFDSNNLKYINDSYGHAAGDAMLINLYNAIEIFFGSGENCYRIGGDEFAVIFTEKNSGDFLSAVDSFCKHMETQKSGDYAFDTAFGYAKYDSEKFANYEEFSYTADKNMYIHKEQTKQKPTYNM